MHFHRAHLLTFLVVAVLPAAGAAQSITEFPLHALSEPRDIVAGPDGNLWYIEGRRASTGQPGIGRMTTSGSAVDFAIEESAVSSPNDLAVGPDGNLWFTQSDPNGAHGSVNRMTPAGVVTRFPLSGDGLPLGIAAGPDGNVWFTLREAFQIGRITPGGVITLFSLGGVATPQAITAGPDGNLWFTGGLNRIGRITPTGVFDIWLTAGIPTEITAGPDGNLWFTRNDASVGRITPQGVITDFPVPEPGYDITAGPDGNLWFARGFSLGRITPSGAVTEIPIPALSLNLTTGPDGNLWFTEPGVHRIARLTLTGTSIDRRILPVVGSTPGALGTFFRTSVQLHNAGTSAATGRIVFHPSGFSGSDSDTALSYTLGPGSTQSIADLLPAMGATGLGSADLLVASGPVPVVTARVFNDAGTAGTTGFTEVALRREEAIQAGQTGRLIVPADLATLRLNIGVRTLDLGATVMFTVRDASGSSLATFAREFPPTYHLQQPGSGFFSGLPLPSGGSIAAAVTSGSLILYGATVDNRTGDPSLQLAAPAP